MNQPSRTFEISTRTNTIHDDEAATTLQTLTTMMMENAGDDGDVDDCQNYDEIEGCQDSGVVVMPITMTSMLSTAMTVVATVRAFLKMLNEEDIYGMMTGIIVSLCHQKPVRTTSWRESVGWTIISVVLGTCCLFCCLSAISHVTRFQSGISS